MLQIYFPALASCFVQDTAKKVLRSPEGVKQGC
jgi:hypothetical protein